jgi:hypothetical protein
MIFWSREFGCMTASNRVEVKGAQRCRAELAIVWEWKALRAWRTYSLDNVSYKFRDKSYQRTGIRFWK